PSAVTRQHEPAGFDLRNQYAHTPYTGVLPHFEIKYSRAGVLGRTLSSSLPGPWLLSVMRTPVALPPSSNGMEQRYGASFLQSNISFRSEPVRTSRTATQGNERHASWSSAS